MKKVIKALTSPWTITVGVIGWLAVTMAWAADAAPAAVSSTANGGDAIGALVMLLKALSTGDTQAVVGALIIILTWLLAGKWKNFNDISNNPKFEWLKPTLTIALGLLGVLAPQLAAGVAFKIAIWKAFTVSGGAALVFKLAKTFLNSWSAMRGNPKIDIPAPKAEAVINIADEATRKKAWQDLMTSLSGGKTV